MKVLYDCQALDMQKIGGVSRCFAELYIRLKQFIDVEYPIVETDNVYFKQLGFTPEGEIFRDFLWQGEDVFKKLIYKLYYNIKYDDISNWDKWPQFNKYKTYQLLKSGSFDIFHPTFYDDYFLQLLGNKPFVITVHDMIPELFPQFFGSDNKQVLDKKMVIPKATHIIAVSEQTKRDLVNIMKIPEEKITVVYHGTDLSPFIPSANAPFEFEYLLYVGNRKAYKNFDTFVRASVPLLKRYPDLRIVCTGKSFSDNEKQYFQSLGILKQMVNKFVFSDQELLDVYHYALAFVYPSLYEGFGIPILEAYKAGCPVMLNNTSCFPEIAGEAAIFFDLHDEVNNFVEKFEMLYSMSFKERQQLIQKQHERLSHFSWDKAAQQVAEVYQGIL